MKPIGVYESALTPLPPELWLLWRYLASPPDAALVQILEIVVLDAPLLVYDSGHTDAIRESTEQLCTITMHKSMFGEPTDDMF